MADMMDMTLADQLADAMAYLKEGKLVESMAFEMVDLMVELLEIYLGLMKVVT